MAKITWFETTKSPKKAILAKVFGDNSRMIFFARYAVVNGKKCLISDTYNVSVSPRFFLIPNVTIHCGRVVGEYRLSYDDEIKCGEYYELKRGGGNPRILK